MWHFIDLKTTILLSTALTTTHRFGKKDLYIMDPELVEAYQNAEYIIYSNKSIVVLVDQYNCALEQLLQEQKTQRAAFITAFNPFSETLDNKQNQQRNERLIGDVEQLGLDFLKGIGRDKSGNWQGEESLLIFDVTFNQAQMLGNRYGQNAILFIEEDAIPKLVLLSSSVPIITHIPHSSMTIPPEDRVNFLVPELELLSEVNKLNDHFTDELFHSNLENVTPLIFPVNRFLVDVERFERDDDEPMSVRGMGALYTHDTKGKQFRPELSKNEREKLLAKYYRPHHRKMHELANDAIMQYEQCIIVDAHSFPDIPLPCDVSQGIPRPDICLGTDAFHTPTWLIELIKRHFEKCGYQVEINAPYSGTMVPLEFYKKDKRLLSIMIEVNRRLYLSEDYRIIQQNFEPLNCCINDIFCLIAERYRSQQILYSIE